MRVLPQMTGALLAPERRLEIDGFDRLGGVRHVVHGTHRNGQAVARPHLEVLPVDYLVWLFHWGLIPRDEGLRQLELFATEVMPEFGIEAPAPA